jgi:hypothetical protein
LAAPKSVFERTGRWITNHLKPRQLYSLRQRFTEVYRAGTWSDARLGAPRSGLGSTIENTAGVRAALLAAIERLFAGRPRLSIIDAPCGDMTWMPLLLAELAARFEHIDYLGIDIVEGLVAGHSSLPAPAANVSWRFECLDITRSPIPPADLIFCKDLVNHLAHQDVARLLANLRSSGCAYAMITSNRGAANVELPRAGLGATRALDLQAPPFDWPAPIEDDGYLALWELPGAADFRERPI